jgi:hypothetical protein
VRLRNPIPTRKVAQNRIFVGDKPKVFGDTELRTIGNVMRDDQDRERLVLFAQQIDEFPPWPWPTDSVDLDRLQKLRKRRQDAFQQRTVPAIEALSRKSGIHEVRCKQKQAVSHDLCATV